MIQQGLEKLDRSVHMPCLRLILSCINERSLSQAEFNFGDSSQSSDCKVPVKKAVTVDASLSAPKQASIAREHEIQSNPFLT